MQQLSGRILTFHLYQKAQDPVLIQLPNICILSSRKARKQKGLKWPMCKQHFMEKLQILNAFSPLKISPFPDLICLTRLSEFPENVCILL
jgi:hypothetical protein